MRCPFCTNQSLKVLDKREHSNLSFRRRRECLKCNKRFTTYERIETVDLRVAKKSGEREQFNRNKILKGILRACEKRPVTTDQINNSLKEIEIELRSNDTQEINSQLIGELVMEKLFKLDKVAYIRFASVYREFADLEEFKNELEKLTRR